MRIAAIEIGTNSTKFIVAEPVGNTYKIIEKISIVNRLSQKMYGSNQIIPEAFENAIQIVGELIQKSNFYNARLISIFSTSVLREAANRAEFIGEIERLFGIRIEVIDGKREAYYAYKAGSNLIGGSGSKFATIDIGGGSTEIISGTIREIEQKLSLPLGAVRLSELFIKNDPVSNEEIKQIVDHVLANIPDTVCLNPMDLRLIGTGGTVKTIGTIFLKEDYQNEKAVDGLRISKAEIEAIYNSLLKTSLLERRQIVGLNPKRADVIIAGAVILLTILNTYGFPEMTISSQGVLEGFVSEFVSGISQ